jgi:hypothetical protein
MTSQLPVYRQHLGDRYELLPAPVRAFHELQGRLRLTGRVSIKGAETALGRMLAALMRFPADAPHQPFSFELDATPAREVWTRYFPSRTMKSCLSVRGEYLAEAFGPIRLFFQVEAAEQKLVMHLRRMTFLGIPLPGFLVPGVKASEHGAEGHFHFDIEASWPGELRVVAYSGSITLPGANGSGSLS